MALRVRKFGSPRPTASLPALTSSQQLRSLNPYKICTELYPQKVGEQAAELVVQIKPQKYNKIQILVHVPSPHPPNPPEFTI